MFMTLLKFVASTIRIIYGFVCVCVFFFNGLTSKSRVNSSTHFFHLINFKM